MSALTLNYSTFNESFFERTVTKVLSVPQIGANLPRFIFDKITPMYANLLLEFSGFKEYAHEITPNEATDFIRRFTKVYNLMLILKNNVPRNQDNSDLVDIINKIVDKLLENIEMLEDIENPNFSYQISTNYKENDWNDPLNDHWDNY